MDDAKQQLTETLAQANNILVTVSRNPTIDQLAGCLGLTLLLNKQGKHTVAVFSGEVPSILEFLQPEETIEKTTDSLRDFIIALDKSKADKLRYKVEDNVVRIFITPYKTSISEADFEFSQGDFNVDAVVALGVTQQEDLDEAITAHGRILHDATVASINISPEGGLGSINWFDPQASCLSELVTELAQSIDASLLDEQIATALLTGIVSETNRFGNNKTSAQTLSVGSVLLTAGANQQLVTSQLETPEEPAEPDQPVEEAQTDEQTDDGAIKIDHSNDPEPVEEPSEPQFEPQAEPPTDEQPTAEPEPSYGEPATQPAEVQDQPAVEETSPSLVTSGSKLVTEPPTLGGTLTANSNEERLDPATDPFSLPSAEPPQLLERKDDQPLAQDQSTDQSPAEQPVVAPEQPVPEVQAPNASVPGMTPPPPAWVPPTDTPQPANDDQTLAVPPTDMPAPSLAEIEQGVKAEEQAAAPASEDTLENVRDQVNRALTSDEAAPPETPEPVEALGAQPLGGDLHPENAGAESVPSLEEQIPGLSQNLTDQPTAPSQDQPQPASNGGDPKQDAKPQVVDANAPPPVPPPIPFQFGDPPKPQ